MAGTVNEILAVVCPTVTLTSVTGYGTVGTKNIIEDGLNYKTYQ